MYLLQSATHTFNYTFVSLVGTAKSKLVSVTFQARSGHEITFEHERLQ